MRRKEKRLLQLAGLLIAALLFLPNVGLWSLYRDRVFENSPASLDVHSVHGQVTSPATVSAPALLLHCCAAVAIL